MVSKPLKKCSISNLSLLNFCYGLKCRISFVTIFKYFTYEKLHDAKKVFLADKWLSQANGFSKTDFKTEMFFLLYFLLLQPVVLLRCGALVHKGWRLLQRAKRVGRKNNGSFKVSFSTLAFLSQIFKYQRNKFAFQLWQNKRKWFTFIFSCNSIEVIFSFLLSH